MFLHVYSKDLGEVFKTNIMHQTAFWSDVKSRLGMQSLAVNIRIRKTDIDPDADIFDYIMADMLVLIQQVSADYCVAYVPYGPEIDPGEDLRGSFLEDISEQLRSFLPVNCIMIRYDLTWQSFWSTDSECFDPDGKWLGPPAVNTQEFRFNYGTHLWNIRKSASNLLPSNTVFVDLKPDTENILAHMKSKTRYNIGLSMRKGVEIEIATFERLEQWYALYAQTAARNGFYLHDIGYFKAVMLAQASDTQSPAEVLLLFAQHQGEALAAMFLVISGSRATYLYGASSDNKRELMPTYALQWKAMEIAKACGCTEYDMFGVAPEYEQNHPMSGLNRFKLGFGGEVFHAMGCWDYPLIHDVYRYYTATEMGATGYHLN